MLKSNEETVTKSHAYLAELFSMEQGSQELEEKLVKLIGRDNNYDYAYSQFLAIEDFLSRAFDEQDAEALAALQYFCARHRIICTQMPAYLDFANKLYASTNDLKEF